MAAGCTSKKEEIGLPATPPDQVVLRFFDLISKSGKLTTKEAMRMMSRQNSRLDPNTFRKWTQGYGKESKIKIIETIISKQRNKSGDLVATVRMEILSPSVFGGDFTSTSNMNLVLDEEVNKWKIDFMAETINEEDFLKAPKEARAEPLAPGKSEAE